MGQENCHPKPGDLIEIDQKFHQHWALFLGDGYVINLTPVGKKLAQTLGVHNVPEFIRKVKKQPLKEVVGNNKWCINNKSDQDCTPLPEEEIIQHAESLIDMEMTYHGYGSNCERFVKRLRYGDQSDFSSGEMHIPEMAHGRRKIKHGDLIEIKRPIHPHWALYVGKGCVVHVTAVGTETMLTRMVKVKKDLLTNVVGNYEWHVNNKYDWSSTPLPVEEIIWRAERWIGKEVPYDVFGSNCERFVKRLRYGDQTRNFVCGEMHIPAMTHGRRDPDPGDLIEIKRPIHHHWALYVGDGYVIHVTAVDENALPLSAGTETTLTRKVKVKKQRLVKVVGNYEWRIYNKYDWYCTPLPVEEIVRRAERYIGKEVPNTLFCNYSEKFVEKLRYGSWRRDFVLGERYIPDLAHAMRYPDPGDLIEIKRPIHHHWALYVGNGYVIHVTAVDENSLPLSAGTVTTLTRKVKVKKELLWKVGGNDDWAVNNKYDWCRTPLPVEEIIWRAKVYVGKEVPYDVFGGKSGRFVKNLRYGDQWRDFVLGEMHIPEIPQNTIDPDPGDLIEIKWGLYQHWALYMGDGYVVHVTAVGTETTLTSTVMVKKELLSKVAENDEWRVNNKYDWYRTPLPAEEIVRRAEADIDKEVPYLWFRNESEKFVVKLRYGDQPSDFLSGELHIPEIAQDRSDPDPGDLIEIKRRGYKHWALYVGKGCVVHVTAVGTETMITRKAMVKKEVLKNMVENDEWRINNKYDWYRTPLPAEEIIWRAEHWIDKEMPYDVFGRKCERFVKRLRYGGQWWDFVYGKMHIPEMTHAMRYPIPGDLIEIKRPVHHHWALCVGKEYVVHVTAVGTETTLTRKVKVRKELLKNVVGNDEWRIYNKYDWYCTPLPVEEIVRRAEGDIDKEVPYLWLHDESEHFVVKLRYGDQRSDLLSGGMHIPELAQDRRYPNPGDLIEFKRRGYEHWAVYVGEGHVIHVTGLGAGLPSFSVSSVTLLTRKAMVKKELLTNVAGKDVWAVNNKYDWYRTPFPVEEIIRRAECWIGKVVPYGVFLRNCEHFVTELRYGDRVCEQGGRVLRVGCAISSTTAGMSLVTAIFVPALAPFVAFSSVSVLSSISVIRGANIYKNAYAKFRGTKRDILEQTCC